MHNWLGRAEHRMCCTCVAQHDSWLVHTFHVRHINMSHFSITYEWLIMHEWFICPESWDIRITSHESWDIRITSHIMNEWFLCMTSDPWLTRHVINHSSYIWIWVIERVIHMSHDSYWTSDSYVPWLMHMNHYTWITRHTYEYEWFMYNEWFTRITHYERAIHMYDEWFTT